MRLHIPSSFEGYDEEMFFSISNRVFRRCGHPSSASFAHALVGPTCDTYEFFRKVPRGVYQVADVVGLTVSELFQRHTLLPYWEWASRTPLPSIGWQQTLAARAPRHQYYSANWRAVQPLQFCVQCIEEDISRYGEPFWRRAHQLPGVRICPQHEIWLSSCCPRCGWRASISQMAYPPQWCTCGMCFRPRRPDDAQSRSVEVTFAKWSATLLTYKIGSRQLRLRFSLRAMAASAGVPTWTKRSSPDVRSADEFLRSRRCKLFDASGSLLRRVLTIRFGHVLLPALVTDVGQVFHPAEVLLCVKALLGSDADASRSLCDFEGLVRSPDKWVEVWRGLPGGATRERAMLLGTLAAKLGSNLQADSVRAFETALASQLGLTRAAVARYRRGVPELNRHLAKVRPDLFG